MEAASGFEPLHKGFADLSLSHLGTAPHTIKAVSSNSMRGDRNPQDLNNFSYDDLQMTNQGITRTRHSYFVIRHFRRLQNQQSRPRQEDLRKRGNGAGNGI